MIEELNSEKKYKEHASCPSCEQSPLVLGSREITTNTGMIMAIIWCADCGHTLNVHVIGKAQPIDLASLGIPQKKLVRM